MIRCVIKIIDFIFRIPETLDLAGPLEVNNLLDNTERLFEGQVHGPECLLKRGNEMFTTINGGEVIKITGDHITHVAKFGKPCGNFTHNRINIYLVFKIVQIVAIVGIYLRLFFFMTNRRRYGRTHLWTTTWYDFRYSWQQFDRS